MNIDDTVPEWHTGTPTAYHRDFYRGFWDLVFGHEFSGWSLDHGRHLTPHEMYPGMRLPRLGAYNEGAGAGIDWKWDGTGKGQRAEAWAKAVCS